MRSTSRVSTTSLLVVGAEHVDDVALVDVGAQRLDAGPRSVGTSASIVGPFLSQSTSSPPHWLLSFLTQPSYSPKSLRKRWYLVSREVEAGVGVVDRDLLEAAAQQDLFELRLLVDVRLLVALLEPVERRLGDVDVAGLDERRHVAEEEGEDERADVRAVDVGVGHDDDLVVARLLEVELVADAGADGADHGEDLVVLQHLVDARLLDVDDLAAQRQDRLEAAVAGLLGRAAGRVALDEVELGEVRVADGAVGQLARQACEPSSTPLRRVRSRALRAALRARAAVDRLVDDLRGPRRGSPRGTRRAWR